MNYSEIMRRHFHTIMCNKKIRTKEKIRKREFEINDSSRFYGGNVQEKEVVKTQTRNKY
jgi:hypothetical protein